MKPFKKKFEFNLFGARITIALSNYPLRKKEEVEQPATVEQQVLPLEDKKNEIT